MQLTPNHAEDKLIIQIRLAAATPLYWVLAGLTLLYGAAVWGALQYGSPHAQLLLFHYNFLMLKTSAVFVSVFILLRFLYVILIRRPQDLVAALVADLRATVFSPRRITQALPVILLFPVFFSLFTSFKYQIPFLVPFSYDPLFAAADRFLHGGRQPWEILQPVLGVALITFIIGCGYKFWFLTKFCFLFWQAFSTALPVVRAQFFLTTLLSWAINGSLLAVIFSSAGPCFYDLVYPGIENPYEGLMRYLRATHEVLPVWDLPVQDWLWYKYTDGDLASFAGISAFPSMHVSYAFIFLLTARHYGRAYTAFFAAFFMLTLVGSVHLGWHYAVDGYFSVLTTWLIWLWSGRLVRNFNLHHPAVLPATAATAQTARS